MRPIVLLLLWLATLPAFAMPPDCLGGSVFEDRNGNGRRDAGEAGLAGIKVSDGVELALTDGRGDYRLPTVAGRTRFIIKPPGHAVQARANGLPGHWRAYGDSATPESASASAGCGDFALTRQLPAATPRQALDVLVFADPQVKSLVDVDYYRRDIVDPVVADGTTAGLGLTLGDLVNGSVHALYPALNAVTARLGVPWLHVAGNHDVDPDAATDADSLRTFHRHYGPDTIAWEEAEASFVVLDDVIHLPGESPAYIGGLRADQFAFLGNYLPTLPKDRLLVVALHIPLFDGAPGGRETFRRADRERLFGLLRDFPQVLVLSGHGHVQRHVHHGIESGWQGSTPLHEYNVGAACGAYWSGAKDAAGIPDATMADGTPNGHARLRVAASGGYALSWHPARLPADDPALTPAMALHAPKVLRQGAYPAWGVYANVFMGEADTRVEYRIGEGTWQPMRRVDQPDPRLLLENARDDLAESLRGFDRSPEAKPSTHLWRGALPTGLSAGDHRIEVRAFDRWQGEQRARTTYRLQAIEP